jgi:hypothetical protein
MRCAGLYSLRIRDDTGGYLGLPKRAYASLWTLDGLIVEVSYASLYASLALLPPMYASTKVCCFGVSPVMGSAGPLFALLLLGAFAPVLLCLSSPDVLTSARCRCARRAGFWVSDFSAMLFPSFN